MSGRILYKNMLRTLDPSSAHAGWTDTHRLTDEDPKLCAEATGHASSPYELIYDLGIARTATGVGVVNHNMLDTGFTLFVVKTGSTDNGTTWDETRLTVGSIQTYSDYTPSFAGVFSGSVTKRYWRFEFLASVSAADELLIGQLCLFNAKADLPTAPSAPRQFSGGGSAVTSRGLGGYEARHDVGVGSWRRLLRWKKEPGGTSVWTQVRDLLRYARQYSQWGLEPVCWVPHDAEKPNAIYDVHPCAYCVFDGIADSEALSVESTRRYDVVVQLRELTFDGLL